MMGIKKKGQTPIEIIGLSVVILVLLLLVFVTTYNRNEDTKRLLLSGVEGIQCNRMSASIARIYSNRAVVRETLHLATAAILKRNEGSPGGIIVGGVSCSYVGDIESQSVLDTTGITLSIGNWCFERGDSGVLIEPGACE